MQDEKNTDMRYEYWLSHVKGVGPRAMRQLRKYSGSAREVYEMSPKELSNIFGLSPNTAQNIYDSRQDWDLDREYDVLWEKNISFITMGSREYPKRLREIPDPPGWLFYIGSLPEESRYSAAIVGARACSEYAFSSAVKLGKRCADLGVNVISGMARGVDGAGHTGCMENGGKTWAVLGCGVDIVYPPEHYRMYERIIKEGGGIISEYPPGMGSYPRNFPPRNRIISGLSDVVIIVEGREKSGSLITADHALEQGREVYVVPGPMDDIRCMGSNRLIKQGANIILSVDDMVSDIGLEKAFGGDKPKGFQIVLEKEEEEVYSTLNLCPKGLDEICDDTGLSPKSAAGALFSLIDMGMAEETFDRCYKKTV